MSMTQEEIEALMNDTQEDADVNDIDDILAGIDGIVENDEDEEKLILDEKEENNLNIDELVNNVEIKTTQTAVKEQDTKKLEKEIDDGIYPLPSSNEHKVVNQLNEVAEDTEEKASQIFDALSFILDENEKSFKNITKNNDFIDSQIVLLNQLTDKFPKIEILKENLTKANEAKELNQITLNVIESQNNKMFEAMETMQYHDINRQKIERVMHVIKKLSSYLNGIFVDDSTKDEVHIAKHISGDSSESLNDDDLESLISEFENKD